ncbi:agamous-like MADS-box protein AGL62 [Cucurbita maxima]|uniref:Agamous-like MADS-box protein AGL62 n=1 Tax=Cucurbita maxima TaxID=3661 RepID=A0A6J1IH57_CUCMA|nr:agamous-like MADS-box protein AGL62 [Cucurbita maxima]
MNLVGRTFQDGCALRSRGCHHCLLSVFCFGHPNVDVPLDRYLTRNLSPPKPAENFVPVTEFNRDFADLVSKFEVAKKRAEELTHVSEKSRNNGEFWREEAIERMRLEEWKEFRLSFMDSRAKVAKKVEKMIRGPLLPSSFHLAKNHYVATRLGFF